MSRQAAKPPRLVLLVEDDPDDARMVFVGLAGMPGLAICHVRDGAAALDAMDTMTPSLVLLDQCLPDMTGVSLVQRLRAGGYVGPVIMVSGAREDRIVASALEAGANDFVGKHLGYCDEVRLAVEACVEA